ncbi:hypothetical protein QX776_10160 [Alteromonadaceae bacterium BrNp21-10]|nr:hypothetical protein [Alteromonadaceae bacterium BrNp21-10]
MGNWLEAILFGAALVAFVLGFTSLIMGFIGNPVAEEAIKSKVEYGFFGVTGLIISMVMIYAM